MRAFDGYDRADLEADVHGYRSQNRRLNEVAKELKRELAEREEPQDALRFRALTWKDPIRSNRWSQMEGQMGSIWYHQYDDEGNIIGEHSTLEDLADALIRRQRDVSPTPSEDPAE